MTRTGHCLCGAISSVNVIVPRSVLEIEGTPRVHLTTGTENGNPRERLFCGECGSPMFTMMAEQPNIAIIKAGTLDDRSDLMPTAEVWCRRGHERVGSSPDRARFEGDLQPA